MSAINNKGARQEFADEPMQDEEKSVPLGLGIGEESALDPLANATTGRKLNAGHMVIVIVVVIACGGLWFMRSLSHVSASSGGNLEMENTIEAFLKTLKGDAAKAKGPNSNLLTGGDANPIDVLGVSYTERQVQLTNVQRNPFIIFNEIVGPTGPIGPTDDGSKARAEKRTIFENAANRFAVKSVIMSSEPLANVSGKIVRKGDELVSDIDGVSFRVAAITTEGVTVVGEDARLNLSVAITIPIKRDK